MEYPFYGLLSLAEAAKLLGGIDESTLRKAIARGEFEYGVGCRKFGKQWVLSVEGICRWVENDYPRRRYQEQYDVKGFALQ